MLTSLHTVIDLHVFISNELVQRIQSRNIPLMIYRQDIIYAKKTSYYHKSFGN